MASWRLGGDGVRRILSRRTFWTQLSNCTATVALGEGWFMGLRSLPAEREARRCTALGWPSDASSPAGRRPGSDGARCR